MFKTLMFFGLLLINLAPAYSQLNNFEDKNNENNELNQSPYFLVTNPNNEFDVFPLLRTSVDVEIAGVIADVTVTQVYKNNGKKNIEAVYIFPSSTRSAVYAMTMKIGDRLLQAEIQEKEKAREMYEDAKKEGRSASLLEQEKPNVFKMNVANILPGDVIEVEMKYTELLIPEDKTYEFVYPTVVGPRFVDSNETTSFADQPYTDEGVLPSYDFDINLNLKTGIPIWGAASTSHDVNIEFIDKNEAEIKLKPGNEKTGNKDFILNYKLVGDNIETGILLQEGKDENFFLMMVQPPKRVEPKKIPPREYVFVIDVSGSMHGFPLTIAKKTFIKIMRDIRPEDKFNIVYFSGGSEIYSPMSLNANPQEMRKAIEFINKKEGMGGTRILDALKTSLGMNKDDGYSRTFVVITDGYVQVEKEAFDLIKENLGEANLFAFGIGKSLNRHLIEGMARAGQGEPFFVTDIDDPENEVEKFTNYVLSPVLTDIKVEFEAFNAYDIEPKNIPDLLADRPILVWGKYRGKVEGSVKIKGNSDIEYETNLRIKDFGKEINSEALKYLWARNKIRELDDLASISNYNVKKEVTELGLKYNLLSNYTSFIAQDYKVRSDGTMEKINQPLPLPEGVSGRAIGARQFIAGGKGLSKVKLSSGDLTGKYPSPSLKVEEIRTEVIQNGAVVQNSLTPNQTLGRDRDEELIRNNKPVEDEYWDIKIGNITYKVTKTKDGISTYVLDKGNGHQILIGDNVKVNIKQYDDNGKLVKQNTASSGIEVFEFLAGIGELDKKIDSGILDLNKGGKLLVIMNNNYNHRENGRFKLQDTEDELLFVVLEVVEVS